MNYVGQAVINYGDSKISDFQDSIKVVRESQLTDIRSLIRKLPLAEKPLQVNLDGEVINYG